MHDEMEQYTQTSGKQKILDFMRRANRWQWRAAIIVAVLAVGSGTWLVVNTKPIPGKYRQGLNFQLYYPSYLPKGYSVNTSSFTRRGSILIFSIKAPGGKNIVVSEEHMPLGLDLSTSPAQSGLDLPDEASFSTSVGNAQIEFWGDKFVSSLVTPNTWIILNITGFTKDQGKLVTQSFREI